MPGFIVVTFTTTLRRKKEEFHKARRKSRAVFCCSCCSVIVPIVFSSWLWPSYTELYAFLLLRSSLTQLLSSFTLIFMSTSLKVNFIMLLHQPSQHQPLLCCLGLLQFSVFSQQNSFSKGETWGDPVIIFHPFLCYYYNDDFYMPKQIYRVKCFFCTLLYSYLVFYRRQKGLIF